MALTCWDNAFHGRNFVCKKHNLLLFPEIKKACKRPALTEIPLFYYNDYG